MPTLVPEFPAPRHIPPSVSNQQPRVGQFAIPSTQLDLECRCVGNLHDSLKRAYGAAARKGAVVGP